MKIVIIFLKSLDVFFDKIEKENLKEAKGIINVKDEIKQKKVNCFHNESKLFQKKEEKIISKIIHFFWKKKNMA